MIGSLSMSLTTCLLHSEHRFVLHSTRMNNFQLFKEATIFHPNFVHTATLA